MTSPVRKTRERMASETGRVKDTEQTRPVLQNLLRIPTQRVLRVRSVRLASYSSYSISTPYLGCYTNHVRRLLCHARACLGASGAYSRHRLSWSLCLQLCGRDTLLMPPPNQSHVLSLALPCLTIRLVMALVAGHTSHTSHWHC